MAWGMIGASAVAVVGSIGSKYIGGGDSEEEYIPTPDYYEDPDYRQTQDYLKDFGFNLLEGDIPDYYKAIGESGGQEFEDMLGLTNRDITQSTSEALAKSGRSRGGQLGASTAKAIGDSSVKARYEDYARSLTGKQNLMTKGIDVTEGVRHAGQNEGINVNNFNWNKYRADTGMMKYQDQQQIQDDQQKGQMLGTVINTAVGAYQGYQDGGGWSGAIAGGADALTGGETNFLSSLGKVNTSKNSNSKNLTDQDIRDYYNDKNNR